MTHERSLKATIDNRLLNTHSNMVRPKKHIFISLKSLGTNCCHPFDHFTYIYRTFQHVATIEVLT